MKRQRKYEGNKETAFFLLAPIRSRARDQVVTARDLISHPLSLRKSNFWTNTKLVAWVQECFLNCICSFQIFKKKFLSIIFIENLSAEFLLW